jgi:transcriptional regulator with XRE-family HTH domain
MREVIMSDLYNRIMGKANEKGLSAYALCQEAGVTRSRMSDLKSGRVKTLSSDVLRRLAATLGTSVEYLLYGDGEKEIVRITPADTKINFKDLCQRLDNGQLLSLLNAAIIELQRRQEKAGE